MAVENIALMAHLMRRAGFGATMDELGAYVAIGYEATVEDLLHPEDQVPWEDDIYARDYPEFSDKPAIDTNQILWTYRMINSKRPLNEKLTLFWHGLFATSYAKGNQARTQLNQIDTLRRHSMGSFRDMLVEISRDPAMIFWLDNNDNHKGAINENYGRELLELFSMGVGNYTEQDVREGARAFTGWNFENLDFVVHAVLHDDDPKTFLGHTGNFDGVDILKIILEQPVTAEYIAGKIYRFFVREDLSPTLQAKLGTIFRDNNYELRPLLATMFRSRDFYSDATYGQHIKGPVEHVVTMLKHLEADDVPGVPDFNLTTIALGQHLLNPPSVAGWAQGRSWITPALLQERGNVAFDYLFPNPIAFRDPNFLSRGGIGRVGARLRDGHDFATAIALDGDPNNMTAFDLAARDRDELFNTRISNYRGWEQAMRKLIPTSRGAARIDLTQIILDSGAATTAEAIDYLLDRFLRMPVSDVTRESLLTFLTDELSTTNLSRAQTYMEDPLRMVTHFIMSTPEYQLN